MKLDDCEVSHLHVRGQNVALIIGDRALEPGEGAALNAEFVSRFGPYRAAAYVSGFGWQLLAEQPAIEPPAPKPAAPAAEAPVEPPALAKPAATKSKA